MQDDRLLGSITMRGRRSVRPRRAGPLPARARRARVRASTVERPALADRVLRGLLRGRRRSRPARTCAPAPLEARRAESRDRPLDARVAQAWAAAPRPAAGGDRLARRCLAAARRGAPVRGKRRQDPVDVLLDVVEMERDPEVRVAGRGDDALRCQRADQCTRDPSTRRRSAGRARSPRPVATVAPRSSSPASSRSTRPRTWTSIAGTPASATSPIPATPGYRRARAACRCRSVARSRAASSRRWTSRRCPRPRTSRSASAEVPTQATRASHMNAEPGGAEEVLDRSARDDVRAERAPSSSSAPTAW